MYLPLFRLDTSSRGSGRPLARGARVDSVDEWPLGEAERCTVKRVWSCHKVAYNPVWQTCDLGQNILTSGQFFARRSIFLAWFASRLAALADVTLESEH